MAPLPLSDRDAARRHKILKAISTLFKTKPSAPHPKSLKSDRLKPKLSTSNPPAFALPPGKATWWQNPGLTNTEEYDELMLNPWNDYRKRSLQDQETLAMAINTPATGAPAQQMLEGGHHLTLPQQMLFIALVWLVITFVWGVVIWAMAKTQKMRARRKGPCGMEFGENQDGRKDLATRYFSAIFVLWLMTPCLMFCFKAFFFGIFFGGT
ncbi:hypothetical protein C7212DRAFT_364774 [Tuber magnatum]|uniref:Uncharacterized protein n=1 Tax=Tuber magnatum TaxID=42249 RepID=A0A317SNM9_9PEZI|nr:hypothetical protein C7212DRAFT_364774 [Tuber magnatum]